MESKPHILPKNAPAPKPDISVSLVNYNSTDFLIRCLNSIKEHSNGLMVEILIADNGSVGFEPEKIHQITPNAIITVNQENKGFAHAQNHNFSLSKADFFLLLNPDTLVTEGFFHAILGAFKRFQDVAIVGPNLLSTDGRSLVNVRHFPTLKSALLELLLFDFAGPKRDVVYPILDTVDFQYVECITGAAFAVRSDLYRSLGGLDQQFFMYFEEVDFCKRVNSISQKIVLLPHLKVLHYHGRSSIQTDARQTVYYESYYHYFKKHHGFLVSLILRGLILFNTIARMLGIQIKYCPLSKGWREYSRKTISTFHLLLWTFGLRDTSRGFP